MEFKFDKVGQKIVKEELEITLSDATELNIRRGEFKKLVNMGVDLVGLTLDLAISEDGEINIRCMM